MSIFKACDVRGVVGREWDQPVARRIGRSLAKMIRRSGEARICVGGDFRRSTPALKQALINGLLDVGAKVHDAGQLPTPVVYFAARQLDCSNVAIVTASHNPGEYNGVKFMVAGKPAVPDLMHELQAGLDTPADARARGTVQPYAALEAYTPWVTRQARLLLPVKDHESPAGTKRELKIVVDTMSGACTHVAPHVLAGAGHETISLSATLDPDFSSGIPNPAVDAHLQPVIRRVVEEGADLGVALDGDGDRVIFVDHAGGVVRPEQIGALLIRTCLDRPRVVYDLKSASVLARAAEAASGKAIMQPSGHGFIKTAMIEQQADLGVEVSGHHFFKALGGGDDGLFTALVVSRLVAEAGIPLASMTEAIGWPTITPDLRIRFEGDLDAVLENIAGRCGGEVTRIDGVRAQYGQGWALARPSITEPILTLRFEGRDPAHLREIAARFLLGAPDLHQQVMPMIHE